jgi:ubiquinone/menaquinone biosynthesis C-methylase UbiE
MSTSPAVTFVDPEILLRQVGGVAPGSSVADFGCGSGYFAFAFAKAVGREGRVFAFDIMPSALEAVASRAKLLGLSNVLARRANLEHDGGSGLDAESVDWAVLKDILFQNRDKETILREAYRVLRPQGRALVVEWNDLDSSVGPDPGLRLRPETLAELARKAGFSVEHEIRAGDFHYALVLAK